MEDSDGEAYKRHLARLPDYYWLAEDGLKIQVTYKLVLLLPPILVAYTCDANIYAYINLQSFGSQTWDACFAIQAIMSSDLCHEFGPTLSKAHEFLKASQVLKFLELLETYDDKKCIHTSES